MTITTRTWCRLIAGAHRLGPDPLVERVVQYREVPPTPQGAILSGLPGDRRAGSRSVLRGSEVSASPSVIPSSRRVPAWTGDVVEARRWTRPRSSDAHSGRPPSRARKRLDCRSWSGSFCCWSSATSCTDGWRPRRIAGSRSPREAGSPVVGGSAGRRQRGRLCSRHSVPRNARRRPHARNRRMTTSICVD